ncbi:MAG TPA: hypothetical protein DEP35_20005 [Deltaproteobacteria bacterium]|nr:hypothetical protein [Deltaproteobacteria bacterium]
MIGWVVLCLALAGIASLGGCAAIQRSEAQRTEDLLAAAGFRQFPANNSVRINALKTMKPRTITTVSNGAKTYWVYPDPTNCNCLYAGTESNYQEYKRLVVQKQIADENLAAAEAAQDAAMEYDMWGPWW